MPGSVNITRFAHFPGPAVNRDKVLAQLRSHQPFDARETRFRALTLEFVARNPDFHDRALAAGHVTGSAWVVDTARSRALMLHHRKLDRWLQPGGHLEGDASPLAGALREAGEETGLDCRPVSEAIFDIDVHRIPARGDEPSHLHYDLRYLLEADPAQAPGVSAESNALRWFTLAEVAALDCGPSIERMVRKTAPG